MCATAVRALFLCATWFLSGSSSVPTTNSAHKVRSRSAGFLPKLTPETEVEIRAEIEYAFSAVNNGIGHQNVSQIAADLSTQYNAMPKNDRGLLDRPALNYLVEIYFRQTHHWAIKGFHIGSQMHQSNENSSVDILTGSLPTFVGDFIEKRHAAGFDLQDCAVMISTLEHLILNEHIALLRAAYHLSGTDDAKLQPVSKIKQVLRSFRVLYHSGHDPIDEEAHTKWLKLVKALSQTWKDSEMFCNDVFLSHRDSLAHRSSPFSEATLSFDDTWLAVSEILRMYGSHEDHECLSMKEALVEKDPEMTGRIPVDKLYQSLDSGHEFTETEEQLRALGALDESHGTPHVLIANYMLSEANCVEAATPYYKICCRSECTKLMHHLEEYIGAPNGQAEQIQSFVQQLPSSQSGAPRNLSQPLIDALRQVSDLNGGQVPLHGGLFAQWMHFAYPHECPYPSNAGAGPPFPAEMKKVVNNTEIAHHISHLMDGHSAIRPLSQSTAKENLYLDPNAVLKSTRAKASWVAAATAIGCMCYALWEAAARTRRLCYGEQQLSKKGHLV